MSQEAIFAPMIAFTLLVFLVWMRLGFVRISGTVRGLISKEYLRLGTGPQPADYVVALHHHASNLFEVPVLFYVACMALFVTRVVDGVVISLAWVFVLARLVHSVLVLSTNLPRQRVIPYVLSSFSVWSLWLLLGLRVLR